MLSIKTYRLTVILLLGAFLLSASGCKVTKNFVDDESLLKHNKIKYVNDSNEPIKTQKSRTDLLHVAAQQPNKRVFGLMPFKLWIYTTANSKKETKVRWWIKNKVGEPPAIYDSTLADKSDQLMTNYLQNYGYQYAQVTHDSKTVKKKTIVTYTVKTGVLWHFGAITFPSAPFLTDSITQRDKGASVLQQGARFDLTAFKAERDRIETDLKNHGFFFFSKEYVSYDLDTFSQKQIAQVAIRINQPSDSSLVQQYRINDIYITSDYTNDITKVDVKRDTTTINEFHFIFHKKIVKFPLIMDKIFLKRDKLYSRTDYSKTVKTLSSLTVDGAYKFVAVDFSRIPDKPNYLNALINLTPGKRNTLTAEAQANISQEGYFGVGGSLTYKNKNLTQRSDLLAVDFSPGLQFQFGRNQPVQIITKDFATSTSYYFNKFLLPLNKKVREWLRDKSPKTRLTLRYNYEQRYDFDSTGRSKPLFFYTLHGFNLSYGYEWSPNPFTHHILNPINFTLFLLPETGPYFLRQIDENVLLKNSYQEQIIFGPSYSFIYTNQRSRADKKYMYFRTNLETAGNILMAGFALANLNRTKPLPYTIFDKDFAEYMRGDFDLRGYIKLSPHSSFAGRSYFGLAVPYGNSTSIPFIKQFSSGGPNSLRGFNIRSVGPGGFENSNFASESVTGYFDQTGDMKMEANVELRFDIFKWFKGAIFADMGNVWLIKKDAALPLGDFEFNRFYKEFAIDIGPGFRLDFTYFVVRLDYGIGIRDPSIPGNNKWFVHETGQGPGLFQLAVGYPF